MNYQIEDVFSPRSFPQNTYISRKLDDEETVDDRLRRALAMKGNLIFVSGASKSGKTVFCHKAIAAESYIALSGNQISTKADFWNHIAEQLPLSDAVVTTTSGQDTSAKTGQAQFSVNFGVANMGVNINKPSGAVFNQQLAMTNNRTERQIIQYLIDNDKVLVIDDFHYVAREMQMYIARTLKTELFNGLKAVIISLPHRSDEAIICNPDLIGRTTSIEILPWTAAELKAIAVKGFKLLGMPIGEAEENLLAQESITSPQLMQENCFQLAFAAMQKKQSISLELGHFAFKQTARNYAHYERLVKAIVQGIGRRKLYALAQGSVDIYHLLLLAFKADPPVTELSMVTLKERIKGLLLSKELLSSTIISATINKIIKIVEATMPDLDALEYRAQCLYILDPFLLFYLRWK